MLYQPLKGFNTVFDATLNNDIQDGLVEYFDWALLEKGNYFNVTSGQQSPHGEDYSRLRMSSNDNYPSGRVWEGFKKNWVWQSGVNYSPAPKTTNNNTHPGISGIYINGSGFPITTSGTYAYYVDYNNGRVIFDNVLPSGSRVQVEHSYKWISVIYADNVPWLRNVQYNTNQPTSSFLTQNGDFNIPPEARIQLPAIAIEIVPRRTFRGYELGGGQWVNTDVLFHCLAEDETTRNKLVDLVSFQSNKEIFLFNSNLMNSSGEFPIDYRGVPVSGALRYPDIIEKYNGGKIRLINVVVQELTGAMSDVFYGGIVRMTTEGIKNNI